jgi:hypothetical protein
MAKSDARFSRKARPLLLRWNGTSWRRQPLPWARPGVEPDKVVATGPSSVWVVSRQDESSVVEHWDGARWHSVPSPFGPSDPIADFSATAWNDAWAVGSWGVGQGEGNYSHPLAAHWNGASWTFTGIPSLPGSNSAALESVIAVHPDDVWAMGPSEHFVFGDDTIGEEGLQAIFLHWDGRSWKILPGTSRASVAALATGITAAPDGSVWAIGNCLVDNLVLRWNGKEWVTVRHPPDEHWPSSAPPSVRRGGLPSCPSRPKG